MIEQPYVNHGYLHDEDRDGWMKNHRELQWNWEKMKKNNDEG